MSRLEAAAPAAMTAGKTTGEWGRNWPVLLPSLAGITLAGVNGYTLGVMIPPLEQEFGWSRAAISLGPLIISAMGLFGAPIVGIAIDRFGPRRIAIIGVMVYCCALAFVSTTGSDIASWWLHWAILGVGTMFILPTVWATAINSLFVVHRGKALAVALCGTGLCAAIVPIVTQMLIAGYGWRGAYVGLALLGAAIVLPLVLVFFRGTADIAAKPGQTAAPQSLPGLTAREGFRAPSFYLLSGAVLLFGFSSIALTVNSVPVLRSHGFDAATAAAIAGLIGIGSISGRLGGGFLLDLFDAKKVAAAAALLPSITVALFMAFPGSLAPVAIGALLLGLSAGAEVDACAYLAARHFGLRSFGTLFGAINGIVLFGAGVAPLAANYAYDVTGTYHSVLIALVPISAAAAALFMALPRYPEWPEQGA